ncbi:hypothetical protein C2845_PM17G13160 [Panicum miliaceum]|uniref:Ubiquitin-like protease family profile domain-containing protein n=1 Tax=Panicum miliaceum TaxID=4540 RepID=A0A3L6Q0K4_PANMI|nr:hypothetical protein C2845_PM17G13160 [Panicum miliaceum]
MEGRTTITSVDSDGKPTPPKGVDRTMLNQCGYYVRENIPISYKLWNKVKTTDNDADVIPDTEGKVMETAEKEEVFKKWVMRKMAISFQTFKKNLNKDYVKKGLTPDFEKDIKNQHACGMNSCSTSCQGGYSSAIPKWQKMEEDLMVEGARMPQKGYYNVGFMDPDIIHEKSVHKWPNKTLNNIFMVLDGQNTCEFILLPYNFDFHWILLCIEIDKSRVVMFDCKRTSTAKYQDLINILQKAWALFLKKHIGVSANSGELSFKTDFPIFRMKEELIEPERVRAVQEEICGFLLDEVINPKEEFYADYRISVGRLEP